MSVLIKKQEVVLKKLSRRNWLRNTAIAATGAVMLFLTGCTKEKADPGGLLGGTADTWYTIKTTYRSTKGTPAIGYFGPIGRDWTTPNYTEMRVDNGAGMKFKRHPAPGMAAGWEFLETEDGLWLSLSYGGWVFRDTEKEIAWRIVDGKLYHSYSRWIDYPIGAQERGGLVSNPFNVQAYYAGVGLGDQNILKDVMFEAAK